MYGGYWTWVRWAVRWILDMGEVGCKVDTGHGWGGLYGGYWTWVRWAVRWILDMGGVGCMVDTRHGWGGVDWG